MNLKLSVYNRLDNLALFKTFEAFPTDVIDIGFLRNFATVSTLRDIF